MYSAFNQGFVRNDVRGVGNPDVLDETVLRNQIQRNIDQDQFETEDRFATNTSVNNMHDQYSYQSHSRDNSHTNSHTGTLNSAHSHQHSPHASASSESGSNPRETAGGYVTPTPPGHQRSQSDYESSYHSSSMNSSQHSTQTQSNPFPHGNQIIVQDPHKPDLLN